MSTAPKSVTNELLDRVVPAANADQLGDLRNPQAGSLDSTASGWDAYEVWRRFIKDARDRRKLQDRN